MFGGSISENLEYKRRKVWVRNIGFEVSEELCVESLVCGAQEKQSLVVEMY